MRFVYSMVMSCMQSTNRNMTKEGPKVRPLHTHADQKEGKKKQKDITYVGLSALLASWVVLAKLNTCYQWR